MSAHGFKSVFMAGGIAAAALGCYLVSLRVASERAALESVENRIVLAQRDIRLLNTEIGTRGRLAQLERWNVKVIRLSAPTADQFVQDSFQLATLAKPEKKPAVEAQIVYASAPATPRAAPVVTHDDGTADSAEPTPRAAPHVAPLGEMMHVASYTKPAKPTRLAAAVAEPKPAVAKAAAATLPKAKSPVAAKAVKTATADPLGPLSAARPKAKSEPAKPARTTNTTKDPGSRQ